MHTRETSMRRRAAAVVALIVAGLAAPAGAAAKPDLVVTALGRPPAFARPGQNLNLKDTVKNEGDKAAAASVVRYLLSRDGNPSSGDLKLGQRKVGRLRPGKKSAGSAEVKIPQSTPVGLYYLLACADGKKEVTEFKESNNCKRSGTWMLVESGLRVTANSLDVQRSLSQAQEVTEEIDASLGGTVETTGPDGVTYELDIPAHALYGDTEITMTPVSSVTGNEDYFAGAFENAVELKPEGLRLYKPATLTIDPPTGLPAAADDGFSYNKAGEDFHLYPLEENAVGTFNLFHFSAYGIGEGADRQALGEFEPISLEGQTETDVSNVVDRFKNGQINQDEFDAEFSSIAIRHFFRAILPVLAKAQSGEGEHEDGLEATEVYGRWKQELEVMGLDDYFNQFYNINMARLIDYGHEQLQKLAKNIFDKAWGRCRRGVERQKNLDIMTAWGRTAELTLGGAAHVLGPTWQERVYRCADPKVITGEVHFESIVDSELKPSIEHQSKTVHREFSGTLDVAFKRGPIQGTARTWDDNGSTINASWTMDAEGIHTAAMNSCAFAEEHSFDLNGAISELDNVNISLIFDPKNPGWPTDNAALSVGGVVVNAPFSHQDVASPSCGSGDSHTTPRNAPFDAPTCPATNDPPTRPSGGMRGIFSNKGGGFTLDFACSETTPFDNNVGAGTHEYTISGTLNVGSSGG